MCGRGGLCCAVLPRYFQSSPASGPEPLAPDAEVHHVIDVFQLREREIAVGLDGEGRLHAVPAEAWRRMRDVAQRELARFEVAGGRRRRLDCSALHLFDLQAVEQRADEPGPNDSIYLYGSMYGPLDESGARPAAAHNGQLTVTRADVLDGLAAGAAWPFRYATSIPGRAGPRFVHLLLPGDRVEELEQGRGAVLAYPAAAAGGVRGLPGQRAAGQPGPRRRAGGAAR